MFRGQICRVTVHVLTGPGDLHLRSISAGSTGAFLVHSVLFVSE